MAPNELSKEQVDQIIALRESGRLNEALEAITSLMEVHPDNQLLHNVKGTIHAAMDELELALECYRAALKLQPNYSAAHNNIGFALKRMGRYGDAIEAYQRAIMHMPNYVEAHVNLALALIELNRAEEAVQRCQKALEISPNSAVAHAGLANALKECGHHSEAVNSYETALRLRPDHAETLSNLGLTRYEMGDIEAGKLDFKRALEIDPNHAYAHYNLARVTKYAEGDAQIPQMQTLLSAPSTTVAEKTVLNFALAKAFEDCGEVEQAFRYLAEGNRLRDGELKYTVDADRAVFSLIKDVFASGALGAKPDAKVGGDAKQPIFVLGMPRSGTTLVEQIIASHSLVHGAGELDILPRALTPHFQKASPGESLSFNDYKLKKIRRSYEAGLKKLNVPERFVIDKLPMNFLWIGFIRSAMPNAKIVHVNRDPMATCWSNYKHYFSAARLGYAYAQENVAEFYKLYADLMDFWRERFGDGIYELSYEQLTENQEDETRKLIEWCGLPWEDQCLDFHKTDRTVSTASALQVREAMYKGSSANWEKFAPFLGPLQEKLGLQGASG